MGIIETMRLRLLWMLVPGFAMFNLNISAQDVPPFTYDSNETPGDVLTDDLIGSGSIASTKRGKSNWSSEFTVPGIVGTIYTSYANGTDLYLGGDFKVAGGIIANSIVKWDGMSWSSIGTGSENGVSGDIPAVQAIAFVDNKLFVGGQFSHAGSLKVNGLAYWDGINWNALEADSTNGVRQILKIENDSIVTSGLVWSLFADRDIVYVGGWFQMAGNARTDGIAAWDIKNQTWNTMGGGLASFYEHDLVAAYTFSMFHDTLLVGGKFNLAGGVPANNLAKWDGHEWMSMGHAEGLVNHLEVDDAGNLYTLGYFVGNDTISVSGIGMWDGEEWASIPAPDGYQISISDIKIVDGLLYAMGLFENDSFYDDYSFAKWDGKTWQKIERLEIAANPYIEGHARLMEVIDGKFYLGGLFSKIGNLYPVNVVRWDPGSLEWSILDDGGGHKGIHDGTIYTLEQSGDRIYAGGDFSVAGGVLAHNIAFWQDEEWHSIGSGDNNGINGSVYCMHATANELFVGGYFGRAGTEAAFHIAKWDGTRWFPIGIGVGGLPGAHVRAILKVENYLYVAGHFSLVGDLENYSIPANSIARFNLVTNRWETLGRGIEYVREIPGRVHDLELYGDKILVGGEFYDADEQFYENFAVLSDGKWISLNENVKTDVGGIVRKIKVIADDIYIGGLTQLPGEEYSVGLLKWQDDKWNIVGKAFTSEQNNIFINDIASYHDQVIAGGLFEIDGTSTNLATFDGETWNALNGGLFPGVSDLAIMKDRLFVSGPREIYTNAGVHLGLVTCSLDQITNIDENLVIENRVVVAFPNPARDFFEVEFNSDKNLSPGNLHIVDINGKVVYTKSWDPSITHRVSTHGFTSGVYTYFITEKNKLLTTGQIMVH